MVVFLENIVLALYVSSSYCLIFHRKKCSMHFEELESTVLYLYIFSEHSTEFKR